MMAAASSGQGHVRAARVYRPVVGGKIADTFPASYLDSMGWRKVNKVISVIPAYGLGSTHLVRWGHAIGSMVRVRFPAGFATRCYKKGVRRMTTG